MTIIVRLQLMGAIACFVSVFAGAVLAQCNSDRQLCGPRCLQVICQMLEVDATLDELARVSGFDSRSGVTMLGLYSAAKAQGLQAVGMKMGTDELLRMNMPVIAHLWDNHFVVVKRGSDDRLMVQDPPGEFRIVTPERFEEVFSGFVLLVAKRDSALPHFESSGPDLRLGQYFYDMGAAEEGSLIEGMVSCRNFGQERLTISRIGSSANYLQGSVDKEVLARGGSAKVRFAVDTTGLSGLQQHKLFIHSNDPITPMVQMQVQFDVEPPGVMYSPATVNFSTAKKGVRICRDVHITKSKVRVIRITKVMCDNPFVTACVAEGADARGTVVSLAVSPNAPVGDLRGTVSILTDHPVDRKIDIPLRGKIMGDIDVFPTTLFFGILEKGSVISKKIELSSVSKKAFEIVKVDSPLKCMTFHVERNAEGTAYTLTGRIAEDAPVGYLNSEVVVHTTDADQAEIRIPVYASVE